MRYHTGDILELRDGDIGQIVYKDKSHFLIVSPSGNIIKEVKARWSDVVHMYSLKDDRFIAFTHGRGWANYYRKQATEALIASWKF